WKLAQSPSVDKIWIAPGNAGTAKTGENVALAADDIEGLVAFARENGVDLVVPGPELPLTLGISDAMQEAGIACFGPDKYCAQLEGSKSFARELMAEAGVPGPECSAFTDAASARDYINSHPRGLVIKADGLAQGKGVIVAENVAAAIAAVNEMLQEKKFGAAGAKILIEEKLEGEEASLLCVCDGETALPLAAAQDHKAAFDHDLGPNTGGMGAYSPPPMLPDDQLEQMTDLVIRPVLRKLSERGHPFRGILYAGLMLTRQGPKVLEYNVRFGDPECQPIMLRLESDLAGTLNSACAGELSQERILLKPDTALGVVLAADGYPDDYEKGQPITGIADAESGGSATVFIAGAGTDGQTLRSSGGRVLCVTALAKNLPQAQDLAYKGLKKIKMPKSRFRRDIGYKGIARLARAWR
ncbi:MAG: phosphoribosylamine--glycine ligase, partial [Desulfovibrio sp.]|nr:phosphoribosylamine--glycine ligase [Desulfovibrio sp.]